jgi:hypothetical protein
MSAFGTKRTSHSRRRMSAFGGKGDKADAHECPLLTHSGHARVSPAWRGTWSAGQQFADAQGGNGSTSFIRNDRGDLCNEAGAALESHVAPQPGHGDNETIPKAN